MCHCEKVGISGLSYWIRTGSGFSDGPSGMTVSCGTTRCLKEDRICSLPDFKVSGSELETESKSAPEPTSAKIDHELRSRDERNMPHTGMIDDHRCHFLVFHNAEMQIGIHEAVREDSVSDNLILIAVLDVEIADGSLERCAIEDIIENIATHLMMIGHINHIRE